MQLRIKNPKYAILNEIKNINKMNYQLKQLSIKIN